LSNKFQKSFQQTASASTAQATKTVAVSAAKQSAKASVIAGVAVEGMVYSAQMGNAVYKRANDKMDHEEFKNYAVERTTMSGGSTAGGIIGSELEQHLGLQLGPSFQ